MRILIITLGSLGDVQPYLALGKGLQAAGHSITLCTSSSFELFITDHGLDYGYMSNDLLDLIDSVEGRDAIENTVGIFGAIRTMMKLMTQATAINRKLLKDSWQAAQAAAPDLIIYHPKALGGAHIAEKLGIPAVLALPAPLIVATGTYPVVGLPMLPLGAWYNRFGYKLVNWGYSVYDKLANEFRQDSLGLAPIRGAALATHMYDGQPIPVLHSVSRHVVPRPSDWPAHVQISGYWFLDQAEDWAPPPELQAFLDAGDPPVYVGFGSMAGRNPRRLATMVIKALQQAGLRGIIATGWGGLDANELPDTILKLTQVPHDWLFPQVAAVIHHGGAGTTGAGLRAGKTWFAVT
jgi:sterol 3beta-glucosyltransferase